MLADKDRVLADWQVDVVFISKLWFISELNTTSIDPIMKSVKNVVFSLTQTNKYNVVSTQYNNAMEYLKSTIQPV